jgi:hypothetical protein
MAWHFVERARREAWRRRLAAIRHTQRFNIFTEHTKKNVIAARGSGCLTTVFDGVVDGAAQNSKHPVSVDGVLSTGLRKTASQQRAETSGAAAHNTIFPTGIPWNSQGGRLQGAPWTTASSLRLLFCGEKKRGAGKGAVWALGWGMEQRRSGSRACHGAGARAQGILGAVAAGRSWSSAATEVGSAMGRSSLLKKSGRHGARSRGSRDQGERRGCRGWERRWSRELAGRGAGVLPGSSAMAALRAPWIQGYRTCSALRAQEHGEGDACLRKKKGRRAGRHSC